MIKKTQAFQSLNSETHHNMSAVVNKSASTQKQIMKQEGYIPVDEFQALVKELYMSSMVADHDVPARHTVLHTNLQIE